MKIGVSEKTVLTDFHQARREAQALGSCCARPDACSAPLAAVAQDAETVFNSCCDLRKARLRCGRCERTQTDH
jgi:hypothetical protein